MTGEVCAAVGGGVYSGEVGVGLGCRTLCTFTHLAPLSHHTSVWKSKSNLLQSVQDTTVDALTLSIMCVCESGV